MKRKETLVFVHGAWDSAKTWRKIKPELEARGHRVVTIDLPGHGDDTSPLVDQSIDTYVDKIVDTINALDENVILFGHSMGGVMVTNATERIYEKIDKLVYIAAFMLRDGWSANGVDGQGFIPVKWRRKDPNAKLAHLPKEIFDIEDKPTITQSMVSAQNEGSEEKINYYFKYYECVDALYGKVKSTDERWGSVPRYYIKTRDDKALPPFLQDEMLSYLPCKRVFEVDSAHVPQLQNPKSLLEKIIKIIED